MSNANCAELTDDGRQRFGAIIQLSSASLIVFRRVFFATNTLARLSQKKSFTAAHSLATNAGHESSIE
jgi:hypothetical protein